MKTNPLILTYVRHLLQEGGAVGHLSHVYDNPDMTFAEMKSILEAASEGRLERVSEKLDGMNLVFTWDVATSQLKVARNGGDISRGGLSAAQLAEKFYGRSGVEDAFNSAFEVLSQAMSSLSKQEATMVFGPSMGKWYSVEVIYASNPNVIQYDSNSVVFHGWPIFEVQSDGNVERTDDDSGVRLLSANIERMQNAVRRADWQVHGPVLVALRRMSDGSTLAKAVNAIDTAISAAGVTDSNTVQDYLSAMVMKACVSSGLENTLCQAVAKRILKEPGAPNIVQLKKMDPAHTQELTELVNTGPQIIKDAMLPIEKAISDFAVKVLECLDSSLIGDNQREVMRLRAATQEAIDALQGSGDPASLEFLQRQLAKLGSTSNITSAMEGVVFIHKGQALKFTGSFAMANQILGFFKYGGR